MIIGEDWSPLYVMYENAQCPCDLFDMQPEISSELLFILYINIACCIQLRSQLHTSLVKHCA